MPEPASLQPSSRGVLQLAERGGALEALPRRQAQWVAGTALAAFALSLSGLWTTQPELALTVALGAGAAALDLRRLWAAPLVLAAVTVAGLLFTSWEWPAVLGAGGAAGALGAWMLPQRTDWLDSVNGALGTLTGSSLGLWAATALVPEALPMGLTAVFTCALVALVASQGLLPVALRFDHRPQLPTLRQIQKALKVGYRPPVFRAIDLYQAAQAQAPDVASRRGMAEVATWVFRLQATLQTLDTELGQIDPSQVRQRIEGCRSLPDDLDAFTRERRLATAQHLERLLEHREAIEVERGRTEALVDYALAFLEEARAGLAIARELPGEAAPDRLHEVLGRLRNQAREGDARRRTARELGHLEQQRRVGT